MRAYLFGIHYKSHTVYAHNGGKFDYLALFGNYWETFGPDNVTMNDGRLIQAVYRRGHHATYFRDSLNIIPASLAKIGAKFGAAKGETPTKFIHARCRPGRCEGKDPKDERPCTEGKEPRVVAELDFAYCELDCEILFRALSYFQERLGHLRPTLPSTAMAVFRREFFPAASPIRICRAEDLAFRDAYYGGRVEAYRLGRIPLPNYTYDVNSLYPYAMISTDYPAPDQLRELTNVTPKELVDDLLKRYEGFASVRVRHPDMAFGLLPYVRSDKRGDRLLFPVGEFSGSWCFPELRWFLENGGEIIEVSRVVYAPRMESPFKTYVARYYDMKQFAEGFEREMAKLMLNALYGKFAEFHAQNQRYAAEFDLDKLAAYRGQYGDADWEPISRARSDGYYVFPSRDGGIAGHSVFSWASYITSRARVVNAQIQTAIRAAGGEVYYTDTDSFTTSMEFNTSLSPKDLPWPVSDGGLGDLKLVADDAGNRKETREIRGNKHYLLADGTLILKGVKRGARMNAAGKYEWSSVIGLKEAIRRGLKPGSSELRQRAAVTPYDKRTALKDGSTLPIKVVSI